MKTLYKLILFFFTVFMVIPKGYSQNNADPGIGILMSPASVLQDSTGILSARVGNYGNGTIVKNSLRVTISVGANAEIMGVASGSDTRWNQLSLTTGFANTIKLTNSGGGFNDYDVKNIILIVRGNVVSSANGIAGNIVYITASNPLLCGGCSSPPLNVSQGNASNSNDNSETSLAVTCYIPVEPVHANCWDTYTFNTTTCAWVNNDTAQPTQPALVNCWDTYTFNTATCAWDNNNSVQPTEPAKVNCWDTFTFNTTSCTWVTSGTQPAEPTTALACYETRSFNTGSCTWDVTGSKPVMPNAGTNGTLTICAGITPTEAELFIKLIDADTGGSWTNTGLVYTYTVSATTTCAGVDATSTVTVTEEDGPDCGIVLGCGSILVNNAISPNGDALNDKFIIDNIDDVLCYPENTVEIYNRWGILVFETKNYNNTSNAFDGNSKGRTTLSQSTGLPSGTYFYILNYTSVDNFNQIQTNRKDGYLYLTH
jgi:gliding motility-associated-like protein